MFVMGVTTNVSQRIVRRPVQLPAPVTFNMSQLGIENQINAALDLQLAAALPFIQ